MTYCCGILVAEGLVMIADTRTNAGLDNISTFRKLHLFERPGEKVMMLASAGSLSVTQTVVSYLREGLENPRTGATERLLDCASMLDAASLVGRAMRTVIRTFTDDPEMNQSNFQVTFLFGGQIAERRLRLFMIYTEGNFIEATEDTPYLQIGEHKYGKPVLDRAVTFQTDPQIALKLGLVSMDFDHALQSQRRPAHRHCPAAPRWTETGNQPPHRRYGRLFRQPARELVGCPARRAQEHPRPALWRCGRLTLRQSTRAIPLPRPASRRIRSPGRPWRQPSPSARNS